MQKMIKKSKNECFKKLLQEVHQENASLNSILEFRAKYPETLWTEIIYSQTGDSILHVAARLGKEAIVLYILEKWSPLTVDIKNNDCKTPLHEAAQFSQPRIVEILLSYTADANAIKRADWTPLMLACTRSGEQSQQTVAKLLKANSFCKFKNKDGWTPLHLACRTGDLEIVTLLLNHDIETIEARTQNGRTVLHIACLHGNLDIVELLLGCNKVSVHAIDKCGTPPIHDAVCSGSEKLVRLLLNHDADINAGNSTGFSCIHIAAGAGLTDMLQFLIKDLNMNPNVVNNQKMTPLHCAARNKKYEAMKLLKQFGADPGVKNAHNLLAGDYFRL